MAGKANNARRVLSAMTAYFHLPGYLVQSFSHFALLPPPPRPPCEGSEGTCGLDDRLSLAAGSSQHTVCLKGDLRGPLGGEGKSSSAL